MEVQAVIRSARVSTKKVVPLMRRIQGLPALQAQAVLAALPSKTARLVSKTLASALANAEHIRNDLTTQKLQDKITELQQRVAILEDVEQPNTRTRRRRRQSEKDLAHFQEFASSNRKLAPQHLRVKVAQAGQGTPLRRWMTRARGGADTILKRTSHLRIVLTDE